MLFCSFGIRMAAATSSSTRVVGSDVCMHRSTISSLPVDKIPQFHSMWCGCIQIAFGRNKQIALPIKWFNCLHLPVSRKRIHTAKKQTAKNAQSARTPINHIKLYRRKLNNLKREPFLDLVVRGTGGQANWRDYKVNCMTIFGVLVFHKWCHMRHMSDMTKRGRNAKNVNSRWIYAIACISIWFGWLFVCVRPFTMAKFNEQWTDVVYAQYNFQWKPKMKTKTK